MFLPTTLSIIITLNVVLCGIPAKCFLCCIHSKKVFLKWRITMNSYYNYWPMYPCYWKYSATQDLHVSYIHTAVLMWPNIMEGTENTVICSFITQRPFVLKTNITFFSKWPLNISDWEYLQHLTCGYGAPPGGEVQCFISMTIYKYSLWEMQMGGI